MTKGITPIIVRKIISININKLYLTPLNKFHDKKKMKKKKAKLH